MRKFLLATSAAALALTFSGPAFAEPTKLSRAATTVAPPETTTTDGLVFSKDADQAKPMDKPDEQAAPPAASACQAGQAQPSKPADQPPRQAAKPVDRRRHRLSAAESAIWSRPSSSSTCRRSRTAPGCWRSTADRNFAPLWVASGKPTPRAEQASSFLQGVAADGLDPADYPTPRFGNADPAKLAADELAMTNSVVTFARHASIGRVAFTRVSGAVYFDQKAPNRGRRSGQARRQHGCPRHARRSSIRRRRHYKALKARARRSPQRQERRAEGRLSPQPRPAQEGTSTSASRRRAIAPQEAKATDVKPKTRERRHHHRQHGALALDAARSRRDLRDGEHPGLHAEGRAGRQDRVVDQDRRRQARRRTPRRC